MIVTVISEKKEKSPGFRIIELHARSLVRRGEAQSFSFSVKNTGGRRRRFVIPVRVSGKRADSAVVRIGPGEIQTFSGSMLMREAGKKQLEIGTILFPFRVYQSPPESVLLDLKWTLRKKPAEEDRGYMLDRSGFHNSGQLVNGGPGKYLSAGSGAEVGSGRYVSVGSAESLDIMDSSMTMMAWIFPGQNASGLADIFSKGDHHVIQLSGSGQLSFFAGGWGRGDCSIGLPADWSGHWHHVAAVCDGRLLKVYLDGVEAGSTLTDEPVNLSNGNHWNLGRNEEFPGIRMFNGRLNYVRVYAEALSGSEIRTEMERELPVR